MNKRSEDQDMDFTSVVLVEAERGFAIYNRLLASRAGVTKEMRHAAMMLNALRQDALAGEEMDRSDAARAINLADSIAVMSDENRNGLVLGVAERVFNAWDVNVGVKTLLTGLVLGFGVFVAAGKIPMVHSVPMQIMAVLVAALLLGFHSMICAGAMVSNTKAGYVRTVLSFLVAIMPVFALITVWEMSHEFRNGITYDMRFVSLFFAQGIVGFMGWLTNSTQENSVGSPAGGDIRVPSFEFMDTDRTDPNLYQECGNISTINPSIITKF